MFVWQKAAIILYGSHTYICVAEGINYTIRDLTHIFVWQKVEIIR